MTAASMELQLFDERSLAGELPRLVPFVAARAPLPLSWHPAWPLVLHRGLGQKPMLLEAYGRGECQGLVGLVHMKSWLFGRFLVSLPYLNYGGVLANTPEAESLLLDEALKIAERLDVRYLELREVKRLEHAKLAVRESTKVNMHLALPDKAEKLWKALDAKVRNQVRKGQKHELTTHWGAAEVLDDFYSVFSQNMRDLGTPVYGVSLFAEMLKQFPGQAELGVIRLKGQPIACAILLHGWGITEVPSASSLRAFNPTCANMLLYWSMLERTIERGQSTFDFGRSSPDSNTYKFKKQWGAEPQAAYWHYHLRQGSLDQMRPENPKYQLSRRIWQKLPVGLTRILGPRIVRGIP